MSFLYPVSEERRGNEEVYYEEDGNDKRYHGDLPLGLLCLLYKRLNELYEIGKSGHHSVGEKTNADTLGDGV